VFEIPVLWKQTANYCKRKGLSYKYLWDSHCRIQIVWSSMADMAASTQVVSSYAEKIKWIYIFFLICIVGGGIQSPLGTAATNSPIVTAPGNYDGEIGGMIGRGNEVLGENLPQCRLVHHKPHMLHGREHEPLRWEASD
jgi:hypothetical protein